MRKQVDEEFYVAGTRDFVAAADLDTDEEPATCSVIDSVRWWLSDEPSFQSQVEVRV